MTKTKTESKPKSKTKVKSKIERTAKPKSKTKTSAQLAAKSKSTVKKKAHGELTEAQTAKLLRLLDDIVKLRLKTTTGLKTFTPIHQILNGLNQKYKTQDEKLHAIVNYGIEKDPAILHEHFYVVVDGRDKDENDVYTLLTEMGKGKIKIEEVISRMHNIYKESAGQKKTP